MESSVGGSEMKIKTGLMLFLCLFLLVGMKKDTFAQEYQTFGDFKYTYDENGDIWLQEYVGDAKEVVVPGEIEGKRVRFMGEVFYHNEIVEKVTLPEGMEVVSGFDGCTNLVWVDIPKSTKKIDNYAFYQCENLQSISLPKGLVEIGDGAFEQCISLTQITIPNTVKVLEQRAFYRCESLSKVTLSKNLTVIQDATFEYCESLKSIKIPGKVKRINEDAFSSCDNLKKITLPNSLVAIEKAAISCNITQITIPKNVVYLGNGAVCSPVLKKVKVKSKKLKYFDDSVFNSLVHGGTIEVPAKCYNKYKDLYPYGCKVKKVK